MGGVSDDAHRDLHQCSSEWIDTPSDKNSVVAIFNTHTQAEDAIRELEKDGVDMEELSIVGKDRHTEENVVGYAPGSIARHPRIPDESGDGGVAAKLG